MLSPHELATLLLLKDAPGRIEMDRAELVALRALELVVDEPPESDIAYPRVTPRGDAVLRAMHGCTDQRSETFVIKTG